MKMTKKIVSYVLVFLVIFSLFTTLPSGIFNLADVSAVELETEETPTEETSTGETPTGETPTEETSTGETPTGETPTEGIPTEETSTGETPTGETPTEGIPTEEISTGETPTGETPTEEIPTEEISTGETPTGENSTEATDTKQTYTEGDFIYSIINNDEVKIERYNGTSTDVVIPDVTIGSECSELANKKVTEVGNYVFSQKQLISVVFGENIKSIGYGAFYENKKLTNIDLSKCEMLTTIGDYAFSYTKTPTKLILPNSLKSIGANAFYSCDNLISLETGVNLTDIGDHAFGGCDSLITVDIKGGNDAIIDESTFSFCKELRNVNIGDGVKSVNHQAFYNCINLEEVKISNTVTEIGSYAFSGCRTLAEVDIPDSVQCIGDYAFNNNINLKNVKIGSGCTTINVNAFNGNTALESITVSEDNAVYTSVDGALLNKDKTTILLYPEARSTPYTIPDTVNTIGALTFSNCKEITEIVIGNGVTTIEDGAFSGCSNLTKVTIGDSVTTINDHLFSGCVNLSQVIFGKNITTIGDYAFYNNDKLTNLVFPDELQTIGHRAFYSCEALTVLEIGCNLTTIGNYAFYDCKNLKTVNLKGGNNATIGYYAFYSCDNLESVTVGDGINTISQYAFRDCTKLVDLLLGNSVETIGNCAFLECNILEEIIIPESVKYIGYYSFANNKELKKVTVGSGCTYIDVYAFYGDIALESINVSPNNEKYTSDNGILFDKDKTTILLYPKARKGAYTTPGTVTIIEEVAFSDCKNLTELVINEGVTTIEKYAFQNNNTLKTLILPDSLVTIGYGAFYNCVELEKLEIGSNLETIAEAAFYNCGGLQSLEIKGGNNAIIKKSAFESCIGLQKVIIGDGVTTIDHNAFQYCYSMNRLKIGSGIKSIKESAFNYCSTLNKVKIYGKELEELGGNTIPNSVNCNIYCYEKSTTHTTLEKMNYQNIEFFKDNEEIRLTDIKVNEVSITNFDATTTEYTVDVDDIETVNITPIIEPSYTDCNISKHENNVYTLDVLNESGVIVCTYKITVKEKTNNTVDQYTVMGDIALMLNNISSTKVGGSIALPAGTYNLKIAMGEKLFGYNKVVADYCNGLTLNPKFTSYITLNATGGTYTFQFDTITNKLVIKYDSNLPTEYLIGDIDTILKPVENKPLSIGTQQLPAGTYKFKLSIGGKEYGYNKVVDNATTGSLSIKSEYSSYITLNSTGGMYTFVLNTSTNKLEIRHTTTADECTTDVHISGDFNLVLNDKSETGEDLITATGTETLEPGIYTFKVYNYGVVYTSGIVINDVAAKNLSSKYTTPVTLNATGGTYQFTFDKVTGALEVIMLG